MKIKPTNQQFQMQLQQMIDTLRQEIIAGELPEGSFLPSEAALAQRFQMSNKSIRKGLETLVADGFISKIPRVGNKVRAQRARVTLTLACTSTIERDLQLSRVLDDFRKQYPWITVNTIPYSGLPKPGENEEHHHVDVFDLDTTRFQEMREEGTYTMLEPLTESEDAYPFLNEAFRADGQLYIRPVTFSPIVLCYNRAHFKECGMADPHGGWTWDDLVRNAGQLSKHNNRIGFCFHISSENRWPLFLLQSGGRFGWDGDRLRDIRNTKLMEGIQLGKQIIQNKDIFLLHASENNDELIELFMEGKISMILITYMALNDFVNVDLDYDISPLPYMHEPRTLVVSIGLGLNRFSRNKEAARLLIDYLSVGRGQQLLRKHSLSIPALQRMDEAETKLHFPARYALYREIISSYRMHDELNFPWRLNQLLAGQLQAYWAGLLNDDELCDRLVSKMSRQI